MSVQSESFVNFLYQGFYGRPGDAGGLTYWGGRIDADTQDASEVTAEFLQAPEFFDIVAPIARLYEAAFNRTFDSGGLDFWVGRYRSLLDSGSTLDQALNTIAAEFIASPEFESLYGTNLSNQQLIEALYQNVLDRPGEAAGVTYWTGVLDNGASRAAILTSFSESPENFDNSQQRIETSLLYEVLDGRPPTPAELTAAAGQTTDQVIDGLLVNPEYDGPPVPGPVTLAVADADILEGASGTTLLNFIVTLSVATSNTVTVNYATSDGTATQGPDYLPISGTLTFAPGEVNKVLAVTVNGDASIESNETLMLTLSNISGAQILDGTATGTILNDDAGIPVSFTTGPDTLVGTAGDDVFTGGTSDNPADNTITAVDSVNDGGGMDSLNAVLDTDGGGAFNDFPAISVTGVEILNFRPNHAGAVSADLNLVQGMQQIWDNNPSPGAHLYVWNVNELATVGVRGGDGSQDYLVSFKDSLASSGADTLQVVLEGANINDLMVSGFNPANDFETIAITTQGGNSRLADLLDVVGNDTATTTLTVAGSSRLTITNEIENVTTVNASAQTGGGVNLILDETKNLSFTGGAGDDRVDLQNGLDVNDQLNGSGGTDTVVVNTGIAVSLPNVVDFQVVEGNAGANVTHDLSKIAGLTGYVDNNTGGFDTTLNQAPAALSVSIVADAGTVTVNQAGAIAGGADTLAVVLDNSVNKDVTGVDVNQLVIPNIDTLNLNSTGGFLGAGQVNQLLGPVGGDLNTITLTGDTALEVNLTFWGATNVDTVNAGTFQADLNFYAFGNTSPISFTGGTQVDIYETSGVGDTVRGGSGNDRLILNPGVDRVVFEANGIGNGTDQIFNFDESEDIFDFRTAGSTFNPGVQETLITANNAGQLTAEFLSDRGILVYTGAPQSEAQMEGLLNAGSLDSQAIGNRIIAWESAAGAAYSVGVFGNADTANNNSIDITVVGVVNTATPNADLIALTAANFDLIV